MEKALPGELHAPIRVVTAASLFDGHDAAINIMRRILQSQGAEVIHLGHDRSVEEIATAALQEDAHAVAISSYQGGHIEFFKYLVDLLQKKGAGEVRIYGGGGGTITPDEIETLQAYGVARIFSPEEGRALGLEGMIRQIIDECRDEPRTEPRDERSRSDSRLAPERHGSIARQITQLEEASLAGNDAQRRRLLAALQKNAPEPSKALVVGFTGTGGAGKSSVVDEMIRRFRLDFPDAHLGCLLVDPTRRRSGGALLGDRIRMNAIHGERIFVRSLATRQAHLALSDVVHDAVSVLQAAHFDLILVETAGIGQSDSEIVDLADLSVYVMTPEYGAPSQLEKIDMIDLADLVVINKFDRRGARDALRDVRKQWRRNRAHFDGDDESLPVYPTVARQWSDPGTERLYEALRERLGELDGTRFSRDTRECVGEPAVDPIVPSARVRYLAEIAETLRDYRESTERLARTASQSEALARVRDDLATHVPEEAAHAEIDALLKDRQDALSADLEPALLCALERWDEDMDAYREPDQVYPPGSHARVANYAETLSGTQVPRVALPRTHDWGERVRFLRSENLPGRFPFTSGVFGFKNPEEDPARMFAGEGGPERTNRRFHLLAEGQRSARLSTAFDSVTLYGRDPDERPDIFGKVGNSGVSICTVDDAKKLYSGFDLCAPTTSVSLTINGPAPIILAFFLNAAIDQQVERQLRESGQLDAVRAKFATLPRYRRNLEGKRSTGDESGEGLPPGHDGLGLGLLGIPGDLALPPDDYARIKASVLRQVRGTVQADILKEDQAQNTCIFSTEFGLEMMGDIQSYFVDHSIKRFYSVSVSGYHIAEAGANPITQLAFTLANGFTLLEYYLARGMSVDDVAPSFSFFFSNGLDAEYNVIGRVARRIWAIALRERYGANERSQKLKYHIQTSGRSLHAQEMAFNDIRTTLQALTALQDHCNSLHTNAYDEAVTTPTEESVRRALAIQLVINRELGAAKCENAIQGAYLTEELTDRVEKAVLEEFERLSERGGVLGAMETHYQRGKIQEESLEYESRKHSGALPIIGVNTFENPQPGESPARPTELMRSSDDEKHAQLENLRSFHDRWREETPAALARLQQVAKSGGNVFAELMETVKRASLGQISDALFEVGGRYRRSM